MDRTVIAALLSLLFTWHAHAGPPEPCARDEATLPQAVYLPPLEEDEPYALPSPGRLTDQHRVQIQRLLDRALCAAQTHRVRPALLRLTVHARTDDRGARLHILEALRQKGVAGDRLHRVGRSVVDAVAAWHRARLVVEQLRKEASRRLQTDEGLGGGDPAGMVQPGDLMDDEPLLDRSPLGVPPIPEPRSFVVVVRLREEGKEAIVAPAPATPVAAPACAPPIVQVFCGDSCRGATSTGSAATQQEGPRPPPRPREPPGPPQIDVMAGPAIPVQPYTRAYLSRELGVLGLGLRYPVRRLDLGLRLLFVAGGPAITFNGAPHDQRLLGGGALLQVGGLPLRGRVRLGLGAEVGWLYIYRRIQQGGNPFERAAEPEKGHVPVAGAWLRLDVPLGARLSLSLEASGDIAPIRVEDDLPLNWTMKTLGGINYALR